jgi:hypothetical protein
MSDPQDQGHGESPSLAKNKTVDAIVAVILFVVGVVVIFDARRLGAGWTSDGPGSGYFPFYIALVICISAVGIFYQAMFGKSSDSGTFVDREQFSRVAQVLLPAAVYVLLITFLGIYVASAIYIALFMIILGKYSPTKSVLLGIGVNAFFFVMFEVWFKVPLFKGSLDPLAFLGY